MITSEDFGQLPDGATVKKYVLTNSNGFEIHLLSFGLHIQKLIYPDGTDIVLGYDSLEEYISDTYYLGGVVGRNANRLSNASVIINGEEVKLSENESPKQLHGGFQGFNKKNWDGIIENNVLRLTYTSKDGEEGYPGNLKVTNTFELTDDNRLLIGYEAESDKDTVVNLTRHDYFNLSGFAVPDIKSHEVQINANFYTKNDITSVPTGEILSTKGGVLDFREKRNIANQLNTFAGELPMGYDHNYVINKPKDTLAFAASASYGQKSLEIETTQPGVQLYTAAYVENLKGKAGKTYGPYAGLCLETQHFPDATKNDHFDSTILKRNTTYKHQLIYKFVC